MLSDNEILNVVRSAASNTIGTSDNDSELGQQRADAIDYYHGKMDDMPALPGWSKVTTRDVFQTIESILPDILEVFTSSEDIMEFKPESEEDVDRARQETDVVNQVFYQDNRGFLVLYTFIKDALQAKNGFVKVWWEDSETEEQEHYFDQTDIDLAILQDDLDVEVDDIETFAPDEDDKEVEIVDGQLVEGETKKLHNVIVTRSKDASLARVMAVPPEEIAVSAEAKTLQSAELVRHVPKDVTRSQLLEMGLPEDKVEQLGTIGEDETEEEIARDKLFQRDVRKKTLNRSQDKVEVADNYIRIDIKENGKSELWHIMTGDDDTVLLDKTRITRVPISTMTPIIEPHQLFGISLADLVMDLQRIKTFFTRAAIDNAAALNNQRPIISESQMADSTIDDVLMNRPSAPIVVAGDVRSAITYAQNNNISGDMIGLIKYFDTVQAERTGVTRFGQDMDPDGLKRDISATEFSGQRMDALKAVRLIALIFAETGIRDMMVNIHHVLQSHSGNKKKAIRLNNKFVDVNPREWRTRTDMQINIGLGTGTKQEQIAQLNFILAQQKEAFATQNLQDGPMVTLEQIRYTMGRIIELMGFKTSEAFFNEVGPQPKPEQQEPAPDPVLIAAQMKAQNDKEKNGIEREKNLINAQIKQEDNELDRQVEIFQITQELQLAAQAQNQEFDFKTAVAQAKLLLENKKIDLRAEETGINMGINFAERLEGISTDLGRPVEVGGEAG